ncbi:MAG TPA: metallophosphoesterase [Chitinophagaceae bacterium]|jgi:predicted MPP superfamily phosphohydrolase|nr:metallophosphoesterase [Chitinophagaceae bacterium]HMU58234.1 metallophosphoesterase [Chitinophagaceae bacterium]
MRNSPFWWIFIGFMVLLDIYVFQALKVITGNASPKIRLAVHTGYWVVSVSAIILLVVLPYIHFERQARIGRSTVFALLAGLFFAKVIAAFFFILDDIRRGIQWLFTKLFSAKNPADTIKDSEAITRSAFLSWTGMLMGGGLFGTLLYGFGNKYRYQVNRVNLNFPELPKAFEGLKVIQISDIHSGSFNNRKAVERGVEMILAEKPDLILFTGDLVNNLASEMDDYIDVFRKLTAPMGVYSVLGNHDYGEYVNWESAQQKQENLEKLKQVHAQMGWRLLMNEHVAFEKNGQEIALIGIENWSAKARFPKYGDLAKAYAGAEKYPFKILMSHDPSHWKAEICEKYRNINLTLSGHTHGMQFGVEIPGFKWSPVKYFYPEWAGLYENGQQKLYVNRGFGFIGYPGRVGILPEVTVFSLNN